MNRALSLGRVAFGLVVLLGGGMHAAAHALMLLKVLATFVAPAAALLATAAELALTRVQA
eukprot:COSAG06_NODE_80_length_25388_cov_33.371545_24_plen_60_part_00